MTERDAAIKLVYKSVRGRAPFALEEFVQMLRLWSVVPLHEDGQVIGGVLIKENELHVGYGEKPRASIRPYIKEILGGVIGKYGFAMTTVQADNPAGLRFCERLGFVKLSEENGTIRLRCDRSNYL
jgi:hypothetical protein